MCSHFPHYAEPDKLLKCWANYESPKLWRYWPGPINRMEKHLFFAGFVILFSAQLIFLVMGSDRQLLVVYLVSLVWFWSKLITFLYSQSMNIACPLNRVSENDRQDFFQRNPSVAQAWRWKK